ncbi:MAG: DNA-formamidopyrimidine glycosylase [Rhodospirillaceae bacterium TMED8]|nr:DNA-formamidopyrimidine glycosylase [Magnetovibrio sp.]OUT50464.1 MAG: DNA-formamidopyrimidine glycosylase [Rhodospirillaceae bacterium TMED8]
MPELPEVETVCRGLQDTITGSRLEKVIARRSDLRLPLPEDFGQRLTGRTISSVARRAKFILISLDNDSVLIGHLGMSGRIRIFNSTPPPEERHDHVIFETNSGVTIRFNDPRRFGFLDIVDGSYLNTHRYLKNLGPEPLDDAFDGSLLIYRLAKKMTSLKAALLDQRIVAGLGNIYVCEALHLAGLSPRRRAGTVGTLRAARLSDGIKLVLKRAIQAGGSSLRDHRQPNGELGYFQHNFQVYNREGEDCIKCGSGYLVKRIVQSGRSTFFCSHCQR